MLELLSGLDESLFHAINGAWPSGDTMMWWASKPLAWAPLYVLLIIAVLKKYKSKTYFYAIKKSEKTQAKHNPVTEVCTPHSTHLPSAAQKDTQPQ